MIGLIAAATRSVTGRAMWFAGFVALAWTTWIIPPPGAAASSAWLWVTGFLMLACIVANIFIAAREPRIAKSE